jgi:hypothetical protein
MMTPTPLYLRRAQAAEYIRGRSGMPCAYRTLHRLASVIALYAVADLDAWARSRISGPLRKASDIPGRAA